MEVDGILHMGKGCEVMMVEWGGLMCKFSNV